MEEIGSHDVVVEFGGVFAVEGEPLDFAADFAASRLVPVIPGAGAAEFHDIITSKLLCLRKSTIFCHAYFVRGELDPFYEREKWKVRKPRNS